MSAPSPLPLASGPAPLALRPCPVCGGEGQIVFTETEWRDFAAALPPHEPRAIFAAAASSDPGLAFTAMARCGGCALLYPARLPEQEALRRFYQTYFGNPGYMRKLPGKIRQRRLQIALLKPLLSGRRFLDIGCNVGAAVAAAARAGLEGSGLDLSEEAIATARRLFPGLHFIAGDLTALDPGARFDLIFCTEVIEHVTDPLGFFSALTAHLAPGGLLWLTTPDAGHAKARQAGMAWDQIKPPEHLHLFTRAALARLTAEGYAWRWILPNPRKPGLEMLARRRR
jgi:2-polyprenyl-3-methyl-5-hydroxy-6-metoxy-1,4-benzoquinol methylase